MAKIKIDWSRIGHGAVEAIQNNSGMIVGGLGMIGLALLCRKLNLPYDVLTDPFGGVRVQPKQADIRVMDTTVMLVPNNSVETSIAAICDNAKTMCDDYYKWQAVKKILEVLKGIKEKQLEESTKTYAIMCVRSIAATCADGYYKTKMINTIADIGRGIF